MQKDIHDGVDVVGKKMTLCQLYAKQNAQRLNVKQNTRLGRKLLMDVLKRDKLGARSIDRIKLSDTKEWVIRMNEKGYCYQTINNYKCSLKASFYIAIQDDCVRKNPFDFILNTVIEDDTIPKVALTEKKEEKMLSFVKRNVKYRETVNRRIQPQHKAIRAYKKFYKDNHKLVLRLNKNLDSKTFRDFYYLKKELVNFCRSNNLPTSGGKVEITNRIAYFLENGKVLSPLTTRKKAKRTDTINEDTAIKANFVCTELQI